jgi:hypothetical protein
MLDKREHKRKMIQSRANKMAVSEFSRSRALFAKIKAGR